MSNTIIKTAAGKFGALSGVLVIAAALWVSLGGSLGAAPPVLDALTCLPTCSTVDGRMLVVAGDDDSTLAAVEITIGLRFTAAAGPQGNLRFFDGDRDKSNWDVPLSVPSNSPCGGANPPCTYPDAPKLIVELFADPAGVGGVGAALHTWTPDAAVTVALPALGEHGEFPTTNNGLNGVVFDQDASALSGSNYRYAVRIRPANPLVDKGWNAFKIQADGFVSLLGNQVVGFIGAMSLENAGAPGSDLKTIYPNFDGSEAGLTPTTYDGTWSFSTTLPPFLDDVTVFDGDMDYGDEACAFNDTDDNDSDGIPGFAATGNAVAEGVAQATGPAQNKFCNGVSGAIRTGLPADDNASPAFRRTSPNAGLGIKYFIKTPPSPSYPFGQVFLNENPSGNREWEQFKIQKVAPEDAPITPCPVGGYPADVAKGYAASDCRTDELPGGSYDIILEGMDLSNLNFWFFSFKVEPPPTDYSIGRLVWYDANENGEQDLCDPDGPGGNDPAPCPEEPGIAGVAYSVVYYGSPDTTQAFPDGTVLRTGSTDVNGEFLETILPAGNYTVIIGAANFNSGQPLEGLTSTTGGETENGVEVGSPTCTDTDVPTGCGQPEYNEAIFGYVEHFEECVIVPEEGGESFVGAVHTYVASPPGTPPGYLTLRTTLSTQFVDNTYGTNAHTGWPKGHTFGNLTGSDKMTIQLYGNDDVKRLEFAMDYISASAAPGQRGYDTLGVAGGDGSMIFGSAANIFDVDTSLAVNFRAPGMTPALTVNSPTTNPLKSYTNPVAPYEAWIFEVWYDVTFNAAVFGGAGFGYPRMSGIHASPSKTGSNTEICVYGDPPPIALADSYQGKRNTDLVVAAPGVLANDTPGPGGAITAVLVTGPTNGTLFAPLNANGSFTYRPNNNFVGNDAFTYKVNNANGDSAPATVTIKVKK